MDSLLTSKQMGILWQLQHRHQPIINCTELELLELDDLLLKLDIMTIYGVTIDEHLTSIRSLLIQKIKNRPLTTNK